MPPDLENFMFSLGGGHDTFYGASMTYPVQVPVIIQSMYDIKGQSVDVQEKGPRTMQFKHVY